MDAIPSLSAWIASRIRRKAILGLLLILLSTVFFVGLSIVSQARDFILEQSRRSASTIARFVASDLAASASSVGDLAGLSRVTSMACTDPQVLFAAAMGEDGRLLASSCSRADMKDRWSLPLGQFYDLAPGQTRHHLSGQVLEVYSKVAVGDGTQVFLLLGVDATEMGSVASRITRLIATNALAVYVLGLLALIAAVNRLTRPLEILRDGLKDIGSGRLPSPLRVQGRDEVAELTVAFNAMIDDLRRTQEEITRYQRHLEDLVEDRTQALNRANEELVRINRSLTEANDKLRELDKLKSNFLGIATHELKTPLAVVSGYLESLHEGFFGPMEETQNRVVQEAMDSCSRMSALISDMLDLTRIESGRMPLAMEELPLAGAVEKVAGQMIPLVQKKRLTLDLKEEGLGAVARFDEDRVVQVLVNLVGNAVKFTSPGGSITVSAEAREHEVPPVLAVQVADTGIGIEEKDLPRIFEEFAQVGQQDKEEGTGLGLAICRRIVTMHGGRIWAESEPGVGSRFTFTLPLVAPAPPPSS